MSAVIQELLAVSLDEGNLVDGEEIGWSRARAVYRMSRPMSPRLRSLGLSRTELQHYTFDDSHYGPPEEGFYDEAARIGIAFPTERNRQC